MNRYKIFNLKTLFILVSLIGLGTLTFSFFYLSPNKDNNDTNFTNNITNGKTSTNSNSFVYRKATYLISKNLNPADALTTAEQGFNSLLYRGLFSVNGQLQVEADLVKSWIFESESKSYRFLIHSGETFSDGTPLDANSIKNSLDYLFFKSKNSSSFTNIASVKLANNGTELIIKIKDSRTPLLPLLAAPQAKVWMKNPSKNPSKDDEPLGSGPFRISQTDEQFVDQITLEKNDLYKGKQQYKLKKIRFIKMTEAEAKKAIIANKIDDSTDLSFSEYLPESSNYKIIEAPSTMTWLVAFNVQAPIAKSQLNRECLIEFFNKENFVKQFLPTHSKAIGYLPPSVPGSKINENYQNKSSKEMQDCRSIQNKDSFELLIPREIEKAEEMCESFKNDWSKFVPNFKCSIVKFDDLIKAIVQKKHQAALLAMSMDFPSVEYFLNAFESNSSFNLSSFSSKKLDFFLAQSRRESDREIKFQNYQMINQMIYDQALTLNISYPKTIIYTSPCVKGLRPSIVGPAYTDYSQVELEGDCR